MVDAALFYESRAAGLGKAFLDAVEQAVKDIREHPRRWPVLRTDYRRRSVARFPYAVVYRDDPNEIVLVAVMHLHRRPDYWRDRV